MPDTSQYIASVVKISNKSDHISVGYVQKTAQKQPKILFSACMKTFEISKLKNYTSDYKLGPDMYHLNTFNLPKHERVNEWPGGGAMVKRREFFHCHP